MTKLLAPGVERVLFNEEQIAERASRRWQRAISAIIRAGPSS